MGNKKDPIGVDADDWNGIPDDLFPELQQNLCTVRQRRRSFGGNDSAVLEHGGAGMIGRMVDHAHSWLRQRLGAGNVVLKGEIAEKLDEKNLARFFAGGQQNHRFYDVGRRALMFIMTGKKKAEHVVHPVAREIDEYLFRGIGQKTVPKFFGDDRRHSGHAWGITELIGEIDWLARSRNGEVCFVSGSPKFTEGADNVEVNLFNESLRACVNAGLKVSLVYPKARENMILAEIDPVIGSIDKIALERPSSSVASYITPETRYLLLDHPEEGNAALWVMRNGHDYQLGNEPAPKAWFGTDAERTSFRAWWTQLRDDLPGPTPIGVSKNPDSSAPSAKKSS